MVGKRWSRRRILIGAAGAATLLSSPAVMAQALAPLNEPVRRNVSSFKIHKCENAGGILHHVSGEIVLSQMG